MAKGAYLLPGDSLRQEQSQVAAPVAFLQVAGNILVSQHPGQVAQALPSQGVVRIQDEKPCSAFLVSEDMRPG